MGRHERPGEGLRGSADILFSATVKADELRFLTAPKSSVVFTGDAAEESASGSDRTNLPDQVQENVTYRDVHVDYAIAAKMLDDAELDDPPGGAGEARRE